MSKSNSVTALRISPELDALLPALHLSRPDTALLQGLSDQGWTSLLAFSSRAQLTLQIAQLPTTGFPDWVVEQLKTNLADNILRFERIKATYLEVVETLQHAEIEHVVIKGFTQAPEYVAKPQLRGQSDIDIFCPPNSIDAAYVALQGIGYKPSTVELSYAHADHRVTLVRPGNWHWVGNPYDPEMPLSVELHFCLWNESFSHIRDPGTAKFWGRRTKREVADLSFACLSPADHLAHLTLHILRNLLLRDWIINHVRELACFLHSHADDESFWKLWTETQSPLLRSRAAIAFYYAHAWFGCRMHRVPARDIECLPATQLSWLRYFSRSALEIMFHPNRDSVWLHLCLLTAWSEKWKLIQRTFLPTGIGPIGHVPIQLKNRQLVRPRGQHGWQRYTAYMASRFASFSRSSLGTLSGGLRWRLAEYAFLNQRTSSVEHSEAE